MEIFSVVVSYLTETLDFVKGFVGDSTYSYVISNSPAACQMQKHKYCECRDSQLHPYTNEIMKGSLCIGNMFARMCQRDNILRENKYSTERIFHYFVP